MNEITHELARRFLRAATDGLISDQERTLLESHLRDCGSCRAESESLNALSVRLAHGFHERWDAQEGPSENVLTRVVSQKGRIVLAYRVSLGLKTLAGIAALFLLGLLINYVFGQLYNTLPNAQPIIPLPAASTQPTVYPLPNSLIAFVSEKSGEPEIYTMYADGSAITALTHGPSKNYSPAWSPDGEKVAYISEDNGKKNLSLMKADGSEKKQLTNSSYNEMSFTWSPDGEKIAYVGKKGDIAELAVIDRGGNNIAPVLDQQNGDISFLGWSPDGWQMSYSKTTPQSSNNIVYVINADGSGRQNLLEHAGEFRLMDWQDADHMYVIVDNQDLHELFRLSTTGTPAEKAMYTGDSGIATWFKSPQDLTYVTGSFQTWTWYRLDGTKSQYLSTWPNYETLCQKNQYMLGGQSEADNEPSPDGLQGLVTVFCGEGRTPLYVVSNDGSKIQPLFDHPLESEVIDVKWSPDGKFIVADIGNNQTGHSDLYLIDLEKDLTNPSLQPLPLTSDTAWKYDAVWQPKPNDNLVSIPTLESTGIPSKSGLIAFTAAAQNGNSDIYTVRSDGSGLTDLTSDSMVDMNPFWSPDGTRIAFQSDRSGLMQIYVMDADGSNVIQLTNNDVNHELMSQGGPWSPDGKRLLFTEWGDPGTEEWMLYTIGVDGQNKTLLAEVPPVYTYPSWSPDGKHIAFISDLRLYEVDSDGGHLTEVTKSLPAGEAIDSYNLPNYYWSADSQSLIFIASTLDSISANGQGGNSGVNLFHWKAYKTSLDGNTLILNATTRAPLGGWWKGSYFVTPFADVRPWTWVNPDSTRTVDPFGNCTETSGGGSIFSSSSSGDVAIGAMCPNGDWWLYMVTPLGVMSPLISSPISTVQGSMDRLTWSSDDKFLAFNLTSNGETKMYLVNVVDALKDPSTQPVQVEIGNGRESFLSSWQPNP